MEDETSSYRFLENADLVDEPEHEYASDDSQRSRHVWFAPLPSQRPGHHATAGASIALSASDAASDTSSRNSYTNTGTEPIVIETGRNHEIPVDRPRVDPDTNRRVRLPYSSRQRSPSFSSAGNWSDEAPLPPVDDRVGRRHIEHSSNAGRHGGSARRRSPVRRRRSPTRLDSYDYYGRRRRPSPHRFDRRNSFAASPERRGRYYSDDDSLSDAYDAHTHYDASTYYGRRRRPSPYRFDRRSSFAASLGRRGSYYSDDDSLSDAYDAYTDASTSAAQPARTRPLPRSSIDDYGTGFYRSRSHGHGPSPTINVYNRMAENQDNDPPSASYLVDRNGFIVPSSRSKVRDRLDDEIEVELADMALEKRISRSRGRQDSRDSEHFLASGLAGYRVAPRDAEDMSKVQATHDFVLPDTYTTADRPREESLRSSADNEEKLTMQVKPNFSVMAVTKSSWKRSGIGAVSADIEATVLPSGPYEFLWIHINTPSNDFAELKDATLLLGHLSEDEKSHILEFLESVRGEHERRRQSSWKRRQKALFRTSRKVEGLSVLHFTSCEVLKARKIMSTVTHQSSSRPLLESFTNDVDLSRERKQALNQLTGGKDDKCLYLAQTWFLIIGRRYIVTSGEGPASKLLPEKCMIRLCPSPATAAGKRDLAKQVLVRHGERSWVIPVEDCTAWPSLWATFVDSFEERSAGLVFMMNTEVLNATRWKQVLQIERSDMLRIRLEVSQQSTEQQLAIDREITEVKTTTARSARADSPGDSIDSRSSQTSQPSGVAPLSLFEKSSLPGDKTVMSVEDDLHKILWNEPHLGIRSSYRKAAPSTLADVDICLRERRGRRSDHTDTANVKAEMVIHLKHLFGFFWSFQREHEMFGRFWRAIYLFMTEGDRAPASPFDEDLHAAALELRRSLNTSLWIVDTFGQDTKCLPMLPEEIPKAWLHLHTGVTILSRSTKDYEQRRPAIEAATEHFALLANCLQAADKKMVLANRKAILAQHECCQATGLYWLALSNIGLNKSGEALSVPSIYGQYLQKLVAEAAKNPTDQPLRKKLRYFDEETSYLKDVMKLQDSIFRGAESTNGIGGSNDAPQLYGTDPRVKLADKTIARQEAMLTAMSEIRLRALRLQREMQQETGAAKESRETAIYVFTIVTVIFLPLSFVSSVFGMNTKDIRNLNSNQWLFWVVAIPLTAFVTIVSWIIAGGESPTIAWRPSWHQSRNSGPRVSFFEVSQPPPAYQDVAADRGPYVSSRSRSKGAYDDYEIDLAGMGSRDRSGFHDDNLDSYAYPLRRRTSTWV
ncbi:hypothetical protein AC578_7025 [Pseudocercospora eumusae]|uniref:Uncharacterized protein n=1 Tax=Pseudocercospora eumusae TaxID=321146 RepID=A0A139HCU7_9PEZI|nr:hypothetical protein AC578_7025 [Pseudocercospora eumusae]